MYITRCLLYGSFCAFNLPAIWAYLIVFAALRLDQGENALLCRNWRLLGVTREHVQLVLAQMSHLRASIEGEAAGFPLHRRLRNKGCSRDGPAGPLQYIRQSSIFYTSSSKIVSSSSRRKGTTNLSVPMISFRSSRYE